MNDPLGRNAEEHDMQADDTGMFRPSRRHFVWLSAAALLGGCRSGGRYVSEPSAAWETEASTGGYSGAPSASVPSVTKASPRVSPTYRLPAARPAAAPGFSGPPLISRNAWASGRPEPSLMNSMRPIRAITVHHDGMDAFAARDERSVSRRMDAIRRAHRGREWGDIGYHFAIDPAGRVWQGRPLNYQGAHVKEHNEGNIGIVVLGNYDRQQIRSAQIAGLTGQIAGLMRYYSVGYGGLYTHMELRPTRCPGSSLKQFMDHARKTRAFA